MNNKLASIVLTGLASALLGTGFSWADDSAVSNAELLKEIKQLREERARDRQELDALRSKVSKLEETDAMASQAATQPQEGEVRLFDDGLISTGDLRIGAYGEMHVIKSKRQNLTVDPHRLVLLPSYKINDWLFFNSEIEFEHGGVQDSSVAQPSNSSSGRFDGEVEIEQLYVDALLSDGFNLRSPGVHVIPFGFINLYHEPTMFYSTARPELYQSIIPSTWFEPALGGAFGEITDGLRYDISVTSGLEDVNSGLNLNGLAGVRSARPRLRRSNNDIPAVAGRLAWDPEFVEGLGVSTSTYIAPRISNQRFAERNDLDAGVAMFDLEARYRIPKTGFELRGDVAYVHVMQSEDLLANLDADPSNNVGDHMLGFYGELAYHWWPESWRKGKGAEMDLVPFIRYTYIDLQTSGQPDGSDPIGTGDQRFYTGGIAWFLNKNVVVKADYQAGENANGQNSQKVQFTTGFFF